MSVFNCCWISRTGFPMPECLYCHLVLLLNGGVPSGVSCSNDVEDVLALELEESANNPGTTISTHFLCCTEFFCHVRFNVVFDHWPTQGTRLQACPRGFVPSRRAQDRRRRQLLPHLFALPIGCDNRCGVSGYLNGLQFRRVLIFPAQSTTNYLSSGFFEDGAGSDQTSEGEKNVLLSLSLSIWTFFDKSHASLRAHRSCCKLSSFVLSSNFEV